MVGDGEIMRMRRSRYIPDIPDTLYMVEERPPRHHSIDILAHAIPGTYSFLLFVSTIRW